MRVEVNYELAQALCIFSELGIAIPAQLYGDLLDGELGTAESAAALVGATAELFRRWRTAPGGVLTSTEGHVLEVFPQTWDLLFRAIADGLAEMREEVRAGWDDEMKSRAARLRPVLRKNRRAA